VETERSNQSSGLNFLTTSPFPQMTANSTAGGSICLHLTNSILRLHPRFSLGVLALTSQWWCSISKFSRLLIGVWEQKEHCVIIEASMVNHQTHRYFVQSHLRVQKFPRLLIVAPFLKADKNYRTDFYKAPTIYYTYTAQGLYIQIQLFSVYILYIYGYTVFI